MTKLHSIVSDRNDFLRFLKSKFHAYHLSNVFFRDVQYALMAYADSKGRTIAYALAEELAKELVLGLTNAEVFKKVSPGTWVLNYPDFRKPSSKSEASSKTPTAAPKIAAVPGA